MTMDLSGSDHPADPPVGCEAADELDVESQARETSLGTSGVSLEELVARLEQDPGEYWRACEGLESLDARDPAERHRRVGRHFVRRRSHSPAELLAFSENPETRKAALARPADLEGKEGAFL